MPNTKYSLHLKGYVGGWDFDADYVDFVLNKHAGKEVSVLIDSLGGQLNTALSISAAFKRHGAVHAHFVGMNASAATIASMGAKHISMDASAMYLVHQCSQEFFEWGSLNATDMQHLIDNLEKQKANLDKMDANVAAMYAARCKKKSEDLLALMQKGGWLSAKEALAWGFVDELTDFEDDTAPEITDSIAADCKAHGIPLPEGDDKETSSFKRFLHSLAKAFHAQENTPNHTTMNKIYTHICALLSCPHIEATEAGAASITTAQLDTLESSFEARDKEIKTLTDKVNELTTANAALQAKLDTKPADSTTTVVNDKQGSDVNNVKSDIERFIAASNSAQELFNSLP